MVLPSHVKLWHFRIWRVTVFAKLGLAQVTRDALGFGCVHDS